MFSNGLILNWLKHSGTGKFGIVSETFALTFSNVYCCTIGGINTLSSDFTTSNYMSGRGATRGWYYSLTTSDISIQSHGDVGVIAIGI